MTQELLLNFLPPSTNHSHGLTRSGKMYLKPKTREFRESVFVECKKQKIKKHTGLVEVNIEASYGYYKNGNPKCGDISNIIKQCHDALQKITYEDDKVVWSCSAKKIDSKEIFTKITIKDYVDVK